MSKSDVERAVKVLSGARRDGRPWSEIAWAVQELENSGPVDENGRPWIQRAEAESGYSANQLRRMGKVADFLKRLGGAHPDLAQRLTDRPFSHVEMIGKIWPLDEERARKLIKSSPDDHTFRDLARIYGDISRQRGGAAPITAGKLAARQFREKAIAQIKRDPRKLYGAHEGLSFEILRPVVPFRYASTDYYVVGRDQGRIARIDAIDCYPLHGGSQRDEALRRMIVVATESTFFTRFWIVVPEGESASVILWQCEAFELGNVGVIVIGPDRLHWERVPVDGAKPIPDRRRLWTESDKSRLGRRPS